ncbi:hypothetical protein SAMN04487861_13519 [Selenomonas ruminantium]|uniref:Uncharacterized protein n=1 Tax=Selenomonas ruminantium TaxID=971 RepID=A0A1I3HXX6_SELRU|nr:hypothetical protein [Selenomonas ruminantium]SFI40541.1 hypothetical protein SAMN04487861_13519 [Selenomonas ruminantium]
MMIGTKEAASAGFIDYQLSAANKADSKAKNQSDAAAAPSFLTAPAYQVDIAANLLEGISTRVQGGKVWLEPANSAYAPYTPYGKGWTREDELSALERGIAYYQQCNERYYSQGSPYDPEADKKRLEQIVSEIPKGELSQVPATYKELGLPAIEQDFAIADKPPATAAATSAEVLDTSASLYTPVTEIATKHYRWTEATGIEETLTQEQEIANGKSVVRQWMQGYITDTVGEILKPHATYEEAYAALYGDAVSAPVVTFNEETFCYDMRMKNTQGGAFGVLATQLNRFLEDYGKDDSFYDTLASALNELDPQGENDIVNQIRKMINQVKGGSPIDTESESFQEEVQDAIAKTFGGSVQTAKAKQKQKQDHKQEEAQGLDYLAMQRRQAEEEGQLLDALLGKENDKQAESAGDVLRSRKPAGRDMEFTDKLRRVDEREAPRQPFVFITDEDDKGPGLPAEEIQQQEQMHTAWQKISKRLAERFAAERQEWQQR